jgi:hypothetical protein
MTEITDPPLAPNAANGLLGSWSERPPRRSSCSTAWAGTGAGRAAPAAMAISRKGTPTTNRRRPTNTPATVRKNCFIGGPDDEISDKLTGVRVATK